MKTACIVSSGVVEQALKIKHFLSPPLNCSWFCIVRKCSLECPQKEKSIGNKFRDRGGYFFALGDSTIRKMWHSDLKMSNILLKVIMSIDTEIIMSWSDVGDEFKTNTAKMLANRGLHERTGIVTSVSLIRLKHPLRESNTF